MTAPQLEKGFIRIASGKSENDILTALVKASLNGTEYQIILLVIRKTWGYQKKQDWISFTQFENYTSKSRASVALAIKSLVKKNILVKKSRPGKRSIYQVNKDFSQWKSLVKKVRLVKKIRHTSKLFKTQLVKKSGHTKDIYTKDTATKEREAPKKLNSLIIGRGQGMAFLKEFPGLTTSELKEQKVKCNNYMAMSSIDYNNPGLFFRAWLKKYMIEKRKRIAESKPIHNLPIISEKQKQSNLKKLADIKNKFKMKEV